MQIILPIYQISDCVKYQLFEYGRSSLGLICHGVQDPEIYKQKQFKINVRLAEDTDRSK